MQKYYVFLIDPNTGCSLSEDGNRYSEDFKIYFSTEEEIEENLKSLERKYPFANIGIVKQGEERVDERSSEIAVKYYDEKRLYDDWSRSFLKRLFKKKPILDLYKPRDKD